MKDTEKQKMRIKHTNIVKLISNHQRISHMPYSCHFLDLVEIITIVVCFYLYNLTRYSLIDPWKWKIIFFNFCYFFETVQPISDCTFEIIFAAVNRVYHKQRTHVSVVWRHCKLYCSLPFRKMKTCQVCSRWKIKHPLNETFARLAWCLIRVRHFLKQFEIAKGRKRQRIKAETWAIFPTEVHLPGGTPSFRLYGYVPLDRVWFFRPRCPKIWLASVLNRFKTCPKQGMILRAERLTHRLQAVTFISSPATWGPFLERPGNYRAR